MFIHSDQIKQVEEFAKANEKQNQKQAKEIATNLEENYPGWKEQLPDCPCTQEEIDESDEFERSDFLLQEHHPGAVSGYRSSEPVEIKSSVNPELPPLPGGQQCTFDSKEDLITHGEGAGTPDAYSPSDKSNLIDHYETDVFTSKHMSIEEYHKDWTPNNGNNCRENWGDKVTKPEPESDRPNLEEKLELENNQTSDEASASFLEDDGDSYESFLELDDTEVESFAEANPESFKSFSDTNTESFESFAEANSESFESFSESDWESYESFSQSGAEMTGESSSELAIEIG